MKKTCIVSLVFTAVAVAQGQAPPASVAGVVRLNRIPISNEVLKVKLPRPVEKQLANGIKLLVVESHRVPNITLSLKVPTGNLRNPADLVGLADATAALLRLGTKTRDSRQIADTLAELGASLSVVAGQDSGTITLSAMTENFDAALAVLADVLLNPVFPQSEFDKWKTRQKAQLQQMKSQPDFLAAEQMYNVLYPGDGRRLIRPTVESLDKMTREDVLEHYKRYYVPAGQWAGIAGDITPAEAVARLDKALAGWKGGPVARVVLPLPEPIAEKKVYLIARPGSVQTSIYVANRAISRTNPDYIQAQVMNQVMGGGPSSRLFRNLREAKGYTYGVGSGLSATHVFNFLAATMSVRTEVTEPALAELLREFGDIRDRAVPAEELTDAKNAIVASFVLDLERPASVLGRWMEQREYGFPETYWDTYSTAVMAVTAADVQRVAKKYVPAENAQIIAVGDGGKIAELLKKFGPVEMVTPPN